MMRSKTMLLVGALLMPAGVALADGPYGQPYYPQPQPPVYQPPVYQQPIVQPPVVVRPNPIPNYGNDRGEIGDDFADKRRLERVALRYDQARWANDYVELKKLEGWLRVLVQREIAECSREMNGYGYEYRENRWQPFLRPGEWRANPVQFNPESQRLMRRFEIARQLDFLFGRMDWHALNRKRQMMGELISLERQEIRENFRDRRDDQYDQYDRDRYPGRDRWRRRDMYR